MVLLIGMWLISVVIVIDFISVELVGMVQIVLVFFMFVVCVFVFVMVFVVVFNVFCVGLKFVGKFMLLFVL